MQTPSFQKINGRFSAGIKLLIKTRTKMFVQIGNLRIKIGSIGEYENQGLSAVTGKYYLMLKVSGKERKITFDSADELNKVVNYLDGVLKVQYV